MDRYTLDEKLEMVFIYGEAGRNCSRAVQLYTERFPNGRVPSRMTFSRVIENFKETKTLIIKKRNRSRRATHEGNQIAVLEAIALNPHASCRQIAAGSGISKASVQRILKLRKYHPYHISLHQELHGTDFENRVNFCNWVSQQLNQNPNFFSNVLFSDESTFTNHGAVNRHNLHFWSAANPHWLRQVEHQRPWSVNVWCGIIGEYLIGPFFIEGNLNGEMYCNFLRNDLPALLENVPLAIRRVMWYQHDGCPAHFSRVSREVLDEMYPDRWIGRGGPVNWPPRSPDLTSPDFFLWGFLKDKVYAEVPTTADDMKRRIENACQLINGEMLRRVNDSFRIRVEMCLEQEGHSFEHLLP